MALSQVTEDAVLAWLLGTAFPAPPAQLWLALHSGAQPALGNEIKGWAGGDRIRVAAADFAAPQAAAAGGRERLNSKALLLGAHSSPQTVVSFGLWDAATGGQLLMAGDVSPDVTVKAGDPAVFLTGDLALRVN
jgi:hypothetical protein